MRIRWHLIGLALISLLFATLKLSFSFPRFSDGNVYLYLAQLVAHGTTPYKAFFYSSPPVILYLFALYGLVAGFSWHAFNVLPVLFSILDAVLLYIILTRWLSKPAVLVAVVLYLFSFATLATTDFVSDVHVVSFFLLLGFLAMGRRQALWAGVAVGVAVLAKLYAVVLLPAWFAHFLWRREWKKSALLLAGFVASFGVVTLGFWLWQGNQYFHQIFVSHLGHVEGLDKWAIATFFVQHDWLLLLALLPSIYFYVAHNRRPPLLLIFSTVCLLAFYTLFSDTYYLYWKLLVVWLAVWAAWNAEQFLQLFPKKYAYIGVSIFLLATVGFTTYSYYTQQAHAAVITSYADMVKTLKEGTGPVYGDYTLTPLLAQEANRPIFNNYIDTNPKFFETNFFDIGTRLQELQDGQVHTIITTAQIDPSNEIVSGPTSVMPAIFFQSFCKADHVFPIQNDYSSNAVIFWDCQYK